MHLIQRNSLKSVATWFLNQHSPSVRLTSKCCVDYDNLFTDHTSTIDQRSQYCVLLSIV